jgi:hypothetical protein
MRIPPPPQGPTPVNVVRAVQEQRAAQLTLPVEKYYPASFRTPLIIRGIHKYSKRSLVGSLLTTKLYVPTPRPDLLSRPHLMRRLDEGPRLGRRFTLISAPAGYGKTTVLSKWAAGTGQPAAWLSLDEEDNDAVRFWTYLVSALQQVQTDLGRGIADALRSPQEATDLMAEPLMFAFMYRAMRNLGCHVQPLQQGTWRQVRARVWKGTTSPRGRYWRKCSFGTILRGDSHRSTGQVISGPRGTPAAGLGQRDRHRSNRYARSPVAPQQALVRDR